MIYKKEANFPYPVLTPDGNSYEKCDFNLSIDLKDDSESYRFFVDYDLDCDFLKKLVQEKKAQIIFVIQSKDNKFMILDNNFIDIKKNRISLNKRTSIQLLIKACSDIEFKENENLNEFYNEFKDEILVKKNSVLAFSNVCIFDARNDNPLTLFEKRYDPDLKSDIKFHMGSETIIISFKKEEYQFPGIRKKDALNNSYIYMGLQRALYRFLLTYSDNDEEHVYLDEIDPPENGLDLKLYTLMKGKMVEEINSDNIDEVICKITDRIIQKYCTAVRELSLDGN